MFLKGTPETLRGLRVRLELDEMPQRGRPHFEIVHEYLVMLAISSVPIDRGVY